MSNPANVAGGHKATLNNPNASDEAKENSKQKLEGELADVESGSKSDGDKNPNNVAGGLKATINNPNTSDEAKKDAQSRLDSM